MKLKPRQIFEGLWEPQKKAITACNRYLRSGAQDGAYLIRMPTGTGKTGVIGYIARCIDANSNVLVLTPWTHLRNQVGQTLVETKLADGTIARTFWKKLGIEPPYDRQLFPLVPTNLATLLKRKSSGPFLITSTISSLQRIYSQSRDTSYEDLKSIVNIVVVDEGHYEPAALWAQAIRQLEKPTILLTATPYRNDFKLFRVRDTDFYAYTHEDSEGAGLVRPVKFVDSVEPRPDTDRGYVSFVDQLISYVDNSLAADSKVAEPRVIIRCDSAVQIAEIAGYLNRKGESVLGVHETFPDKRGSHLASKVPNPQSTDAQYWVHQHKLTEGLDDSRFALLAIYARFRNERALVQQIGRVLRVSKAPTRQSRSREQAIVFAPASTKVEDAWKRYRSYDVIRTGTRSETLRILESMLSEQPNSEYFAGRFRRKFDFESKNAHEDLIYGLSARLIRTFETFDWSTFKDTVYDELSKEDRIIQSEFDHGDNVHIWLYSFAGNSPHLRDHALIELRLGYSIAVLHDDLLFFRDTERLSAFPYLDKHTCSLEARDLQRLVPNEGSIAKAVALKSMLLGRDVVTGRVLRGSDINQSAQSLMDNMQICSSVEVTIDSTFRTPTKDHSPRGRRFVSLNRSRVRESDSPADETDGVSLQTYVDWTEALATRIQSSKDRFNFFARYAPPIAAPIDPEPRYILLDIWGNEGVIRNNDTGNEISPDELDQAIEVTRDDAGLDTFALQLEGEAYPIAIRFDTKKRRFTLKCLTLSQRYAYFEPSSTKPKDSILGFLNRTQSFRIAMEGGDILYDSGDFYEVDYSLFGNLLDNIIDIPALGLATSEKGHDDLVPGEMQHWPEGSVFDLIDVDSPRCCFAEEFEGITHMVCDDPAPEAADFIAANLDDCDRVVFIHAKDGRDKILSAEVFQEVCAQAISKLGYAVPGAAQAPRTDRWRQPWRLNGARIPRWRKYPDTERLNGPQTWRRIRRVIDDPDSTKEIWLVLGRSMSRDRLLEAYSGARPHQFMHLAYLLNNTWASATEAGAKLRIFCGYRPRT